MALIYGYIVMARYLTQGFAVCMVPTCTPSVHTCGVGTCADMCDDMCSDMCVDMRLDMCVDMRLDICSDMHVGMCVHVCADVCTCIDMR